MASSIVVPDPQLVGWHPQKIMDQLYAVATAASADILALQSGGVTGVGPVHFVRAASTTNKADLTAVSTTIDTSVTLVAGDRILLKDQSTASQNGIYVVGTVGGGSAPVTRATDFDASSEVQAGSLVVVSEGTANGNAVYELTSDAPITVGSSTIDFGLAISTALASTAPADPGVAAASVGVGTTAARADHLHHLIALNLAGGSTFVSGRLPLINIPLATTRYARGVVIVDVPTLSAFVVSQDGVTYAAGDRVLLANQTTVAQNGLYVVGTVSGTAPLTRVLDLFTGDVMPNGIVVHVSEGTIWAGSEWKAMATGVVTIGSTDALWYPRLCKGTATLSSGVYALGATEGLYLFSTTKSPVLVTRDTANTTTGTTGGYAVPVGTKVAGKSGTGAATITAQAAAGTTNTADVSTISWCAFNW